MAQRVRFRFGDWEVEAEGSPRFIQSQVKEFFSRLSRVSGPLVPAAMPAELPSRIETAARKGKAPTPAEFYRSKDPQSGTEKLIVLAKYLEQYRSLPEFSKADINKLTTKEVRISDIHSQYYTLAVKQGLLRTVGRSKYSLTLSGDDTVSAMPSKKQASKS